MAGSSPPPWSARAWCAYYSRKRVVQQWKQLELLATLDCHKVLEVGPGFGLVTSLMVNSGYEVHTLDVLPRAFAYPAVPHLQKDLREVTGEDIAGFDAILCCETLEHLPWEATGAALSIFRASGARHLIVSVPYMGFQVAFDFYLNRTTARQQFSLKKLLWLKRFAPEPPGGHQWEIGYKGHSLRVWEDRLKAAGWSITSRDFTEHCRSVFHVLRAR
jgi:hypothetical protein